MAKKSEKQYRTVIGVVQFEPRDSETSNGTEVRNITVRQTGFKDNAIRVGATLWPSHSHVEVEKGDVVVLEGSFSRNKGENSDGESVTYNNLSVTAIAVIGHVDEGEREDDEDDERPRRKKPATKKATTKRRKKSEEDDVEENDDDDTEENDDDDIPF